MIFIQIIILIAFSALMITQVIIPIIHNRPLFPMFIKNISDLEDELKEVNQEVKELTLIEEIEAKRKQLEELK